MAVNSSDEGQDGYSISTLGITNMQCKSQLAFLNHLEVSNSSRSQMCSDNQLNNQNYIKKMENSDAYSRCDVDMVHMDIEKGNSEIPKIKDETIETLKTDGSLSRALRGQIRLQIGDKFMQLLMDHNLMLPISAPKDFTDKSATERVHDTPNNRSRKYKRSASFNSRKVVVLSSVLSSLGTMVLIYLTLRVKQIGDGFAHV